MKTVQNFTASRWSAIAILQAFLLLPLCLSNLVKAESFNNESKQSYRKSCSISGQLYGTGLESDRSYFIVPTNTSSDESSSKRVRIDPDNPAYELSSLPPGHYVLRVFRNEAGSLLPVRTYPRQRTVRCRGNEIKNVDFELE